MDWFTLLIFSIFAGTIYFIPAMTAAFGRHRYCAAIFALNLLLGWTFIGWAAALVWALANSEEPRVSRP